VKTVHGPLNLLRGLLYTENKKCGIESPAFFILALFLFIEKKKCPVFVVPEWNKILP
jgi:hypothetical protein